MIEIRITVDTPEAAREAMERLLNNVARLAAPAVSEASADNQERVTDTAPRRRGRPPKDRPVDTELVVATTIEGTATTVVEEQPNISANPENREPQPEKVYTKDDVRNAAKAYVDKFGMDAASEDLKPCLMAATGVEQISKLNDADQEQLKKAIAAFEAAGKSDKRFGQ